MFNFYNYYAIHLPIFWKMSSRDVQYYVVYFVDCFVFGSSRFVSVLYYTQIAEDNNIIIIRYKTRHITDGWNIFRRMHGETNYKFNFVKFGDVLIRNDLLRRHQLR